MAQLCNILRAFTFCLVAGTSLLFTACSTDRDPVDNTTQRCTGTPTYDCSYQDCPSIPGCVVPEHVECLQIGELTPCEELSSDLCEGRDIGCYYEDGNENVTCYQVDEVPDCTALTDETQCRHVGCSYSNGTCTGSALACENEHHYVGCTDLDYCWYLPGKSGCAGTRKACSAMGTDCSNAPGCGWSACTGEPTPCASLDVNTCETQPGCTLEPTGTIGSGGATSAEDRCAGIPYQGCSSEDCANVLGCTAPDTGICEGSAAIDCEFQTTEAACASVTGCTYSADGHCATANYHGCFEGGPTESACGTMPGCTWYAADTCTETSPRLTCETVYTESLCVSVTGCTWEPAKGCSGTATPCASFTADGSCNTRAHCVPMSAGCQGIPISCGAMTAATCADNVHCTWSNSPGCTGAPVACSAFTKAEDCGTIPHCRWHSQGLCTGTATPCRNLDERTCENQLGCYLKAP